jgi:hypothetical protein
MALKPCEPWCKCWCCLWHVCCCCCGWGNKCCCSCSCCCSCCWYCAKGLATDVVATTFGVLGSPVTFSVCRTGTASRPRGVPGRTRVKLRLRCRCGAPRLFFEVKLLFRAAIACRSAVVMSSSRPGSPLCAGVMVMPVCERILVMSTEVLRVSMLARRDSMFPLCCIVIRTRVGRTLLLRQATRCAFWLCAAELSCLRMPKLEIVCRVEAAP